MSINFRLKAINIISQKRQATGNELQGLAVQEKKLLTYRSSPPDMSLGKRCSKNMQQIYRRTPMPKSKTLLKNHTLAWIFFCNSVNLVYIFRTPFPKNTSGELILDIGILVMPGNGDRKIKQPRKTTMVVSLEQRSGTNLAGLDGHLPK